MHSHWSEVGAHVKTKDTYEMGLEWKTKDTYEMGLEWKQSQRSNIDLGTLPHVQDDSQQWCKWTHLARVEDKSSLCKWVIFL